MPPLHNDKVEEFKVNKVIKQRAMRIVLTVFIYNF